MLQRYSSNDVRYMPAYKLQSRVQWSQLNCDESQQPKNEWNTGRKCRHFNMHTQKYKWVMGETPTTICDMYSKILSQMNFYTTKLIYCSKNEKILIQSQKSFP